MSVARIEVIVREGGQVVRLSGRWTLATTSQRAAGLAEELSRVADPASSWDCLQLEAIDSAGAILLWRAWGRSVPLHLSIKPEHWRVFERIDAADHELQSPQVFIRRLREAFKPDERLILLEFRKEDPRIPIQEVHKMSVTKVKIEFEAEGFVLDKVIETLPWQHILVLKLANHE